MEPGSSSTNKKSFDISMSGGEMHSPFSSINNGFWSGSLLWIDNVPLSIPILSAVNVISSSVSSPQPRSNVVSPV